VVSFGISTPDAVRKSVESLRTLVSAFGGLGRVSGAEGEKVAKEVQKIRDQINLLPADQQAAVKDLVRQLDQWDEALAKSAATVLKTFGVQTPEAIHRSADELRGLVSAYGALGTVSKEQADKVVSESKRVLGEIALLPAAQRAALADQTASIRTIETVYASWALKAKAVAVDLVESFHKIYDALKQITDLVDTANQKVRDAKTAALGGAGQSVEALQKQVADLQSKPTLSADEGQQLQTLNDQLLAARQRVADLKYGVDQFKVSQDKVVVSTQDVTTRVRSFTDFIHQNKDAWAALTEVQRTNVENALSGLQDAADQGGATQQQILEAGSLIAKSFANTAIDTSHLTESLREAGGVSFDVKRQLEDLAQGQKPLADGFAAVADQATKAAQAQQQASDSPTGKPADMAKFGADAKNAGEAGASAFTGFNAKLGDTVKLLTEADRLCHDLAACMSGIEGAAPPPAQAPQSLVVPAGGA
jgi:hypothetical protein